MDGLNGDNGLDILSHICVRDHNDSVTRQMLKIRVKLTEKPTEKRLHILITADDEVGLFFILEVTESDYRILRQKQGLLVDIGAFPSMLERLLECCRDEENSESPKFLAVLIKNKSSEDSATFEVQEINAYRRLVHLSLDFCRGSDSKIQEHLGERLKRCQAECEKLTDVIKSVEGQMKGLKLELDRSQAEVERLRREKSEQESGFVSKLSFELSEERNRTKAELLSIKSNYESERRMIVEENNRSLRKLQNQAAALEYENKDLTEKRHRYEATIQTLTEEKRLQQEEIMRIKRELERHKEQNNYLGAGNHELDRNLNRLESKVALLEQEKIRLVEDVSRQDKIIKDIDKQKCNLEADLEDKKQLVAKREEAVKNVSRELLKANDSIKKLQEQCNKLSQKVKLGSDILKEQERLMNGKDEELDSARQELRQHADNLNELQFKTRVLGNEIEDKEKKISDLTKKNKTDEAVIQWLNKQLTIAQSRDPGLRLGPPPDFTTSLSPLPFNLKDLMLQTPERISEKENKESLSLDPKYLKPMSTSTAVKPSKSKNSPKFGRPGEQSTTAGLLRSALHSTTLKSKNQQSVYFTTDG